MKKNILLEIISIIMIALVITGCTNNKTVKSDSEKFREEYTSLNGQKSESGKTIRSIEIPKDNPFVYATAEEIVDKIEKKESFIVYFGFPKCPWCRSVLEQLIKVAQDKEVETIYYVDVYDIRDIKEIDDDGNVKTTRGGSEGYQRLLVLLENVLDDYTLTVEEEELNLGEKRIYAPNVVAISKGKAIQLETGISDELKDPYGKLSSKVKKYAYNKFKCLMDCLEEENTTCQKNSC